MEKLDSARVRNTRFVEREYLMPRFCVMERAWLREMSIQVRQKWLGAPSFHRDKTVTERPSFDSAHQFLVHLGASTTATYATEQTVRGIQQNRQSRSMRPVESSIHQLYPPVSDPVTPPEAISVVNLNCNPPPCFFFSFFSFWTSPTR